MQKCLVHVQPTLVAGDQSLELAQLGASAPVLLTVRFADPVSA